MIDPRSGAEQIDEEGLEALLREALDRHDGPDPESTDFAKLAIEFRGLAVGEPIESDREFAGSRGDAGEVDSARYGDTQLTWEVSFDGMVGAVVPARRVDIILERAGEAVNTVTTNDDGSFEFEGELQGAHRLIVGEEEPWSTPWFHAAS